MKGRRVLGGVLVGGVAFIGAAGIPSHADGTDPNALLDSVEAAAVTPVERREEQEERIEAARDSTRGDASALRSDLPHPHDLPGDGTRSVAVTSAGARAREAQMDQPKTAPRRRAQGTRHLRGHAPPDRRRRSSDVRRQPRHGSGGAPVTVMRPEDADGDQAWCTGPEPELIGAGSVRPVRRAALVSTTRCGEVRCGAAHPSRSAPRTTRRPRPPRGPGSPRGWCPRARRSRRAIRSGAASRPCARRRARGTSASCR